MKLPDHSSITDGQTIEEVHKNDNDEKYESNKEQVAKHRKKIISDFT
jgi:hypothetical protein